MRRDADEIFKVWRAWSFAGSYADLLKSRRAQMKDTVIWNVEEGLKLTGQQLAAAEQQRTELYHRVRVFMEEFEFLICPVNQVPPFPVTQAYIDEINGVKLDNYIDWMKTCYYITVTSHPAISVPAGFTADSPALPVGLQIVGRFRDDFGVLQLAHAYEQETQVAMQRPAMAG